MKCIIKLSLNATSVSASTQPPTMVRYDSRRKSLYEAAAQSSPALEVLAQAGPVWIGVADGRYRLKCERGLKSGSLRWNEALQLDTSGLPAEVEIRGQTIDLPPIRLFVAAEMKLLAPTDGTSVDLKNEMFKWSSVEGAASYGVEFGVEFNRWAEVGIDVDCGTFSGRTKKGIVIMRTESNSLRPDSLSEQERTVMSQHLIPGRTGIWSVTAYDAKNVCIAMTYGDGARLFVAHGLEKAGD